MAVSEPRTENLNPPPAPPAGEWPYLADLDEHTEPDDMLLDGEPPLVAASRSWKDRRGTPVGALSASRLGHTATLLANGQALIAGGVNHK